MFEKYSMTKALRKFGYLPRSFNASRTPKWKYAKLKQVPIQHWNK